MDFVRICLRFKKKKKKINFTCLNVMEFRSFYSFVDETNYDVFFIWRLNLFVLEVFFSADLIDILN